jgi:3-hydroxyisobutyrate dehydrogenase
MVVGFGSRIGFAGLGLMGSPMALNLARAGLPITVWNRTPAKCEPLRLVGAEVATSTADLFRQCRIIILMLADEQAIDTVLQRQSSAFAANLKDHLIVHMGTTSPEFSARLEADIKNVAGSYVEAPVSGSRKPAENAELIVMLAGDADVVDDLRPILAPLCREMAYCGAVPSALQMKLSVNLFLITMVTGLVEAVHFATRHGLDVQLLRSILDAGPMGSQASRDKLEKLLTSDMSAQASITDVLKNNRLVAEAARRARAASPLLDACCQLYDETDRLGYGHEDMVAVIRAFAARSDCDRVPPDRTPRPGYRLQRE